MVHVFVLPAVAGFGRGAIVGFLAVPVIALVVSFTHGVYDGREAPWRHFYALVLHLSTLVAVGLGSLLVYHIIEGGSLGDADLPVIPIAASVLAWLFTLAVVKRVVDFWRIRTVRNPFGLALAWVLAWAVASLLAINGIWIVPGPEYVTVLAAVILVFLVVRGTTRLIFGVRDPR